MEVIYGGKKYHVVDVAIQCGCTLFGIQDEPDNNPMHIDYVTDAEICGNPIMAKERKPNHLQQCICYDRFFKEWRVYMYDDISKYWCGCYPAEHDHFHRLSFKSPIPAFAALIDRVSGKGTWDSNPYVFVYDFKLIK